MKTKTLKIKSLAFVGLLSVTFSLMANYNPRPRTNPLRMDCTPPTAQIDLDVNEVRAKLLTGGDMWWDDSGQKGYIVPKSSEASPVSVAALWMGGFDDAKNLRIAAQTYGRGRSSNDFWSGPLTPDEGVTETDICENWDRHFSVLGSNIRQHLQNYEQAINNGTSYNPVDIPNDVKGWPGRGNPFFKEIYGFDLPDTRQGLAPFWDQDGDGRYNPVKGDYPILSIRDCPEPNFADQMIWYVFNDAGGIHLESGGGITRTEIQAMSYAFSAENIKYHTFQQYKLINRSISSIDSFYVGLWMDPEMGCAEDDYIGCDPSRDLMYVYNKDEIDGSPDCTCNSGISGSYCDGVPIFGVDFLQSPLDELGEPLGLGAFTYYNNSRISNTPPGMNAPSNSSEFYNYLSGSWRDGTPFSFGGNGYDLGSQQLTKFAFSDAPNNPQGWSMCTSNFGSNDSRTIQATGSFRLDPGAVNQLVLSALFVPNIPDYPCPDLSPLLETSDEVQSLFDNCFEIITNTEEVESQLSQVEIFPNPFSAKVGHHLITLRGLPLRSKVQLYHANGQLINAWQFNEKTTQISVDSDLSSGIYFMQIIDENGGQQTIRWVKE